MVEIALIRHGETDWNRQKRMQGHRDIPLNDAGLRQAALLANRLAAFRWDMVASSDLLRAVQTAECVAHAAGIRSIVRDPRLRERHFGLLEGTTPAERLSRWGTVWPESGHGMESDEDLFRRAQAFLADLTARGEGRFVVVTHGGWIRSVFRHLFPEREGVGPGNASVSLLEWNDGRWRCVLADDTSHLSADA